MTHGIVTEDSFTYCREDVAATAALFQAFMAEYRRHPIALHACRAMASAQDCLPRGPSLCATDLAGPVTQDRASC